MSDPRPLGLLDSGVGGLSVLREIRRLLPHENLVYFADQGHVPYGPRAVEEIRAFTAGITRFFLKQPVKAIVVACNAASAASLYWLRDTFPGVPFVGMEPAIKPAAQATRSGAIGVITTKATYQGELFASLLNRYAADVRVVTQVCPEFVTLVERGELDSPAAHRAAAEYLQPLVEAGVDQLVLGCTHFPFLAPVLQQAVGEHVTIVDPAPAVARQTGRVIAQMRNKQPQDGQVTFYTSGDPAAFHRLAARLLAEPVRREQVRGVRWVNGEVMLAGEGPE